MTQPPPGFRPPGYPPEYHPPQAPPGGYAVPYPPPGYRPLPVAPNGAPLADFGQRFLAYLLDSLVLAGLILVPVAVAMAIFIPLVIHRVQATPAGTAPDLGGIFLLELGLFAVLFPVQLLIQYLYLVVYQVRRGQTIGKRVMKIKTVRLADGAPLDMAGAGKRFLVQIGCGLLGPVAYLDGLWQLWDQPYRQCLHDKWPATVVVRVPA